ncbi:hypothetical protein MBCUT_00940 [Methanobrevibacter cuticularis]|uniref:Uncharacterized protein n=1 Tax=Methanobrevibacter cuticularis TaxID=47311 RepID=A0A166FLE3_9EURY|nr:hypothetical protein [Methanobrevibacter cuticularis]KZX17799.1 hypothetical protein MBCUT_00940 [Methanobrevibacter cuticularis]
MANIWKIFGGMLLIAVGAAVSYRSYYNHYNDIFTILGIAVFILGLYLLIVSLLEKPSVSNLDESRKKQKDIPKIKTNNKKNSSVLNLGSNLGDVFENSLGNDRLKNIDSKKIATKVKNVSKPKNPKAVLNTEQSQATFTNKRLNFTPNYQKPMKVSRRPKKRIINENNNEKIIPTDSKISKSEEISRALASDDFIRPIHAENNLLPENKVNNINTDNNNYNYDNNYNNNNNNNNNFGDDIESNNMGDNTINIDPNFPESLPVPKLLRSYVVCSKGSMTSQEAFHELAKHAKEEILLQISSIKEMEDEFLSMLPALNVKIIIQEFDIKDMSYVLLISSLLEQGIKIKTISLISTINLISDDSHALIISENDNKEDYDIGAVYTDSKAITNIKSTFEKSWELANDLDINALNNCS